MGHFSSSNVPTLSSAEVAACIQQTIIHGEKSPPTSPQNSFCGLLEWDKKDSLIRQIRKTQEMILRSFTLSYYKLDYHFNVDYLFIYLFCAPGYNVGKLFYNIAHKL